MIYWAPLFHFYQPPTQNPTILVKVANESYRPVLEVFDEFPRAKATFNINGVLSEMLGLYGYGDVLHGMRKLAERGQIEFTGSGKYHPILPLIPKDEMARQIMLNQAANRQYIGEVYQPRGFFPPELCYSTDIAGPVSAARHEWILVSGIACPEGWPMDVIHRIDYAGQPLAVFFRDDILSNKISFKDVDGEGFIRHLKQLHQGEGDIYVITAMDAETFGHHIQHWDRLFLSQVYETLVPVEDSRAVMLEQKPLAEQHRKLFGYDSSQVADEIRIVTISQLLDIFPEGRKISPRPSSWSTSAGDIAAGNYYPLWKDKDNAVHRLQWDHLDLTIKTVHKAIEAGDNPDSLEYAGLARDALDRALHSCQFWWASRKPMWNINMVDKGLILQREALLNAVKSVSLSGCSGQEKKEIYYITMAARHVFERITDYLFMDHV